VRQRNVGSGTAHAPRVRASGPVVDQILLNLFLPLSIGEINRNTTTLVVLNLFFTTPKVIFLFQAALTLNKFSKQMYLLANSLIKLTMLQSALRVRAPWKFIDASWGGVPRG